MAAALLSSLAAAQPPPVPLDRQGSYRLRLSADRMVYNLAAPAGPGTYRLRLSGALPPLAKMAVASPLPPGRYRLLIDSRADDTGHTFVFSIPVAGGPITFVVTANGHARYDFVLEGGPGWETRATFIAPRRGYTFRSNLPKAP